MRVNLMPRIRKERPRAQRAAVRKIRTMVNRTVTALKLVANISFITPIKSGKKTERNENHIGMRERAIQF